MHLTLELLNASTLCTLTGVSGNKRIHTTGFVTSYAKRIITALREIIHSNRIRTLTTFAAPIFAFLSDNIQQLIESFMQLSANLLCTLSGILNY